MKYDYFIGMLKYHQTTRIRAFNGPQQTNPEHVPDAFALLIPDIISILTENFNEFCGLDQGIVIFGLQPASRMIASNIPLEQERFIDGFQIDYHLCCTLDFFKVPMSQIDEADWHCTDSIVIDFTTGEVMDSDRLLSKLHYFLPEQGKLYGRIKKTALHTIWTIAKIKQSPDKSKGFLFNSVFMREVA